MISVIGLGEKVKLGKTYIEYVKRKSMRRRNMQGLTRIKSVTD